MSHISTATRRYILIITQLFVMPVCVAETPPPRIAGNVSFVVGQVMIESAGQPARPLLKGDNITERSIIHTGIDGYAHLRMDDKGFVAVRPASILRIDAYEWYPDTPARNRISLHLERGIMRSVTGQAGEAARDRFRVNTPLAAIGIRGTDFVVRSQPEVVQVIVNQGAVNVTPFGEGCQSSTLGACAGEFSRDLSASMKNMVIEVRGMGGAPSLIPSERIKDAPGLKAPAQPGEPATSASGLSAEQTGQVIALRAAGLNAATDQRPRPAVETPPLPPAAVSWGRWSPFIQPGETGKSIAEQVNPGREATLGNSVYMLFRDTKGSMDTPRGMANFRLVDAEAWARQGTALLPARVLDDGKLSIDFDRSQFTTSLNVSSGGQTYGVTANGKVTYQGLLRDDGNSKTQIRGALAAGGTQAGYVFSQDLQNGKELVGATRWLR